MRILRFVAPGSEPPALREYNEKLAAYLAANGVIYLDYSGEQALSREAFADPLHMNDTGQVIFTEILGNDLLKTLP
jgi:lysophospholipase L1-like esterase